MAKNLKEYGDELKKMTQDKTPPKSRGKVSYPELPRPVTSTVDEHIKNINKRDKKVK